MNTTEQVIRALVQGLKTAGLPAVAAWQRDKLPALQEAAAVVGIERTESEPTAFSEYLGTAYDAAKDCFVERFGRRLNLTLYVDLYAPRESAAALEAGWNRLEEMLLSPLAGLRMRSVRRGSIEYDRRSAYLKCRCMLSCTAFFTAERSEEGALLQDFILKGMVE